MARVLAIEWKTTNFRVAVIECGEPAGLESSEAKRTTPSVVAFPKTGDRLVGEAAKRPTVTNYGNTICSINRFAITANSKSKTTYSYVCKQIH